MDGPVDVIIAPRCRGQALMGDHHSGGICTDLNHLTVNYRDSAMLDDVMSETERERDRKRVVVVLQRFNS